MARSSSDVPGGVVFVELIRLAVVVLATAVALDVSARMGADEGAGQLVLTALGAGVGYVVGGVLGRFAQGRISDVEQTLQEVSASEIVAGTAGMLLGLVIAAGVTWPVLLFGGKAFTVPMAVIVMATMAWAGMRLGRSRAGDLLRFLGAGGRLPSSSGRARGSAYKLIDTSALVDGRLVDVCRGGWMEGILLVPEFVLYELQGLADSAEPERRGRGQRGLDALASLQRLSSIGVEVLEDDPGGEEVDTKLLKLARLRNTPLVTTDGNLARVAEVQGIPVRNLHSLAESLRPPVLPGQVLPLTVAKRGREEGQGVGYLPDGTMVVVEQTADRIGEALSVEVTSIVSTSRGRMLFASLLEADDPTPRPRLLRGDAG
ncbi:Membrane-associated protein [Euzebya pacifica]|uniref:Membrane-associated protein n=1 Tax=Euzebya pacifica TaxID=1608957 RepID=A0A346Y2Q0_9ACTN|nr:TRAM domain-containing protein [Euzebya pacifica]AXV08747.1 Membrane-associated protein [Euzebya pacifica]